MIEDGAWIGARSVILPGVTPPLSARDWGVWNWRHPATAPLPLPLRCGQCTRNLVTGSPPPTGMLGLPWLDEIADELEDTGTPFPCASRHGQPLLTWCVQS